MNDRKCKKRILQKLSVLVLTAALLGNSLNVSIYAEGETAAGPVESAESPAGPALTTEFAEPQTVSAEEPAGPAVMEEPTEEPAGPVTTAEVLSVEESASVGTPEFTAEEPAGPVVTEEPVETPVEPAVTEEPTEEPAGPIVTEEPVEEPAGPIVTEEPVEEPAGPIVTEEPVEEPAGPAVTEELTETPAGPAVTEEPTGTPAGPAVTEEPTGTPVEPAVTATATPAPTATVTATPEPTATATATPAPTATATATPAPTATVTPEPTVTPSELTPTPTPEVQPMTAALTALLVENGVATVTTSGELTEALGSEEVSTIQIVNSFMYTSSIETNKTIVIKSGVEFNWRIYKGTLSAGWLVIESGASLVVDSSSKATVSGSVENNGTISVNENGDCDWQAFTSGSGSLTGTDRTYIDYGMVPDWMASGCQINIAADSNVSPTVALPENLKAGDTVTPIFTGLIEGVDPAQVFTYRWVASGSTASREASFTIPSNLGGGWLKLELGLQLGYKIRTPFGTTGAPSTGTYSVAAQESETVYVSSSGNDDYLGSEPAKPVQTLNQALENVSDGGTIVLLDNYQERTWVNLEKNVTIKSQDDAGYTVAASNSVESWHIADNITVTFDSVSFNNVDFGRLNTSAARGTGSLILKNVAGTVSAADQAQVSLMNSKVQGNYTGMGTFVMEDSSLAGRFDTEVFTASGNNSVAITTNCIIRSSMNVETPVTLDSGELKRGERLIEFPGESADETETWAAKFVLKDSQSDTYTLKVRDVYPGVYLYISKRVASAGANMCIGYEPTEGEPVMDTDRVNGKVYTEITFPDGSDAIGNVLTRTGVWSGYANTEDKIWSSGDEPELTVTLYTDANGFHFDDTFDIGQIHFYTWKDMNDFGYHSYKPENVSAATAVVKEGQGLSDDGREYTFTLQYPAISTTPVATVTTGEGTDASTVTYGYSENGIYKTSLEALQAAWAAAKEAPFATVTLVESVDLGNNSYLTVEEGDAITLQMEEGVTLSGNSTTSTRGIIYVTGGSFILAGGALLATASYGRCVYVSGGEAYITGGSLTTTGGPTDSSSRGSGNCVRVNGGQVTVSGGTMTAEQNASYGVFVESGNAKIMAGELNGYGGALYVKEGSSALVEGGTFTSQQTSGRGAFVRGTLTVTNGTLQGTSAGIEVSTNGKAIISGGTIQGTGSTGTGLNVAAGTASAVLSGGTFSGKYAVRAYGSRTSVKTLLDSSGHYAYFKGETTAAENLITDTKALSGNYLEERKGYNPVTVGVCTHSWAEKTEGEGYACQVCGQEMDVVATVFANDKTTAYGCGEGTSYAAAEEALQAAWTAAKEADSAEVTLWKDVEVTAPLTVEVGDAITFNAKTTAADESCTLSGDISGDGIFAVAGGKLTIASGKISNTLSFGVSVSGTGETEITGGTLEGSVYGLLICGDGKASVAGEAAVIGTGSSSAGICTDEKGQVGISGGTVSGQMYGVLAHNGTAEISGGTVTASMGGREVYGVYVDSGYAKISGSAEITVAAEGAGTYAEAVYVCENGTAEISGGTVRATTSGFDNSSDTRSNGVNAIGTVTLTGGTVFGSIYGVQVGPGGTVNVSGSAQIGSDASGDSPAYGGILVADTNSTANISGGTISGGAFGLYVNGASGANATITGGDISGTSCGVYVGISQDGQGTVAISGGIIHGTNTTTNCAGINNNGKATITGGTFTASSENNSGKAFGICNFGQAAISGQVSASAPDYGLYVAQGGSAELSGGTFTGGNSSVAATTLTMGSLLVSGYGYYEGAAASLAGRIADSSLLEGNGLTAAAGYGTVTVAKEMTVVAGVTTEAGTEYYGYGEEADYQTAADALKAAWTAARASDSATVTLMADVALENSYLTVGNGNAITLTSEKNSEGRDYTISGTGSNGVVYANDGSFTLTGGTLAGNSMGIYAMGSAAITIQGGEVRAEAANASGLYVAGKAEVDISGGTVCASGNYGRGVNIAGGKVTIRDNANISAADRGVNETGSSAVLNITGGTVAGNSYGVYVQQGTAELRSGTLQGMSLAGVCVTGGNVSVSGNTAISGIQTGFSVTGGTVVISGGTFSGTKTAVYCDVRKTSFTIGDLLVENYAYRKDSDGAWVTDTGVSQLPAGSYTVYGVPVALTQQPEDREITYGADAALTALAEAVNPENPVAYQWYQVGAEGGTPIENATEASYTASGLNAGIYGYYCVATCDGYSVVSRTAEVTVNAAQLSIEAAAENKTYDGTAAANLSAIRLSGAVAGEEWVLGEDFTVSAAFADAEAGENKEVLVTAALITNDKTRNYVLAADTVTVTATIYPLDISEEDVNVEPVFTGDSQLYDGTEKSVSLEAFHVNETLLHLGIDYELDSVSQTEIGQYTAVVTGKGNYAGSWTISWEILPRELTITAEDVAKTYGEPEPDLTAQVEGDGLADGHTLKLSCSSGGENTGTYAIDSYVILDAQGRDVTANYNVSLTPAVRTVNAKTMTEDMVVLTPEVFTYNGQMQSPAYTVTDGEKVLEENVDYTVAGTAENSKVGVYELSFSGQGNYTGTVTKKWEIQKAVLNVAAEDVKVSYDGQPHAITLTGLPESGTEIVYSTDKENWSETAPSLTDAGSMTVYYRITGAHYVDTEGSATVTVEPRDIQDAVVTLGDNLTANGKVQTQSIRRVTVKNGDGQEMEVTYTVSGNEGTEQGSYTMTITGTGNFAGSVTKEFVIAKNPGGTTEPEKPGTDITGTPGAAITGTPGAAITGTPGAAITGTPGAAITGTPGAAITGTPGAAITGTPTPSITSGVGTQAGGKNQGGSDTEKGGKSENGKETAAKTGDNTPLGFWMMLLFVSCAAGIFGIAYKRKKKHTK